MTIARSSIIFASAVAAVAAQPVAAQSSGAAVVDQISSRSVSATQASGGGRTDLVRVMPVRGRGSSASTREAARETPVPRVAPEVIEACRAAQAEDRPPPKGVDCMGAMQALAEAQPHSTAESSLLELFGQRGNVTGAANARANSSANADAVARQLSTGDVQPSSADSAAGAVARGRGAPPANPPR